MRLASLLLASIACAGLLACAGPTVTVATNEPIEIHITLRHEVRVEIDRDLEQMLDQEANREQVTSRGGSPNDDALLRAAKERAEIGEQADGYVGTRSGAPPTAADLANRVNRSRRSSYESLASRYGVDPTQVGRAAAANRIRGARRGEIIRRPDGQWITKDETTRVVDHDSD